MSPSGKPWAKVPPRWRTPALLKRTVCKMDGAGGICSENISNALGWSGQSILSTTADAKRVPLGITLSVILSSISFTREALTESLPRAGAVLGPDETVESKQVL